MLFKHLMNKYMETITHLATHGFEVADSGISDSGEPLYTLISLKTGGLLQSNLTLQDLQTFQNGIEYLKSKNAYGQ